MERSDFRLGISTTVDYSIPIERQLSFIAETGFDFISLGADLEHSRYWDDSGFKAVLKECDRRELAIDSAHVPFGEGYDLAEPDTKRRREAIENSLGFLERCAEFNIELAIIHPHHYFVDPPEKVLKYSIEALEVILQKKPSKVSLAVENLPDERGSWFCGELLNRFDKEEIGWCYDSSHENISGKPFHLLEKYFSRLTATHLSDNFGVNDDHLIPGDGVIDWNKLGDLIRRNRKLKNILLEVGTGAPLDGDPQLFIRRSFAAAKKLFG